jgi:serine O-acetyltransferase
MESFIRRNFELLHGQCDPSWLRSATVSLDSEVELVISDVTLRLPQINTGSLFFRELEVAVETDAALLGVVIYRIAHGIFRCNAHDPALPYFAHLMRFRSSLEVYYSTSIGPRFRIEHGMGLVIGPRNSIGSDFTVHQGVTLGQRRMFAGSETISVGNNCQIFAGAKVVGAVQIGDNVKVGANAVLLTDAESGGTYVGIPARRR